MAERAFLSAVAAYLTGAGLSPAPVLVGPLEPDKAASLPALVLSLEQTARATGGVGERTEAMAGALRWQATVDLANPVLPGDPSFRLLDDARKVLVLPHGGLVRADGTEGAAGPGDVSATLNGNPRSIKADLARGTVTFVTALPATGTVVVQYFVGQWERRLARASGVLRVDACGKDGPQAADLSDAVLDALQAPEAHARIRRLVSLSALGVSSVGLKETGTTLRRRTLRFAFVFEQEIDRPDSSGGPIRQIPVTAGVG